MYSRISIFENKASSGIDREKLGAGKERVRLWLSFGHVFRSNDGLRSRQSGCSDTPKREFHWRRRYDRPLAARERLQELDRSWDRNNAVKVRKLALGNLSRRLLPIDAEASEISHGVFNPVTMIGRGRNPVLLGPPAPNSFGRSAGV